MESKITSHTFQLDPFQKEAIEALKSGVSVVVSAPTGAGKTAIAEFVIEEALKSSKERVFYTTPLKALSNQKFHDFQKKFGEEKTGILTGDAAINRDAQIIVMTTEIYRNMLYGTLLGSVDENLKQLRYLVLDECHYMNDPERGTVWEESIIYSPPGVQILALSATIANAKELTEWISEVHSNTKLIETSYRPVPLRFYYFKDSHLYPLLLQNKQLNPQLKEHKDSFSAHKQKIRDLKRNKNINHDGLISKVVIELHHKGFLPAIYFVFSRRGCETALKECQRIGFGLLTYEERKILSKLIDEMTHGNAYLFKHKHLGLLYQGMAAHHAGLLPQWKSMVEKLFSKGLVKVVFATETLAAGINMPAKTTIISNLGKRGDTGHKNLTSNEFLQMSGRAGRRGMDKTGNVVIKETLDHTPTFAAKLANSSSESLVSRFMPNYSMVLNLLQNHSMQQIKELLNKSFGQYLINKELVNASKDLNEIESKLSRLLPSDQNVQGKRKKYENRINEIKKHIFTQKHFYWDQFLKLCEILNRLKYLENDMPTEKGIMAGSLRGENILFISEILLTCNFLTARDGTSLQPCEFTACVSSIAIDESRPRTFIRIKPSIYVEDMIHDMQKVYKNIMILQKDSGLKINTNFNPILCGLVELWCKEDTKWDGLLRMTNMDEGDIIRSMRRTIDLLRHIKNAPYLNSGLNELADMSLKLMDKEPVKEIL